MFDNNTNRIGWLHLDTWLDSLSICLNSDHKIFSKVLKDLIDQNLVIKIENPSTLLGLGDSHRSGEE